MSVRSFDIHLEHDIDEQYQYEPGETRRGEVILEVSGPPAKIKAVQVTIKGEASVAWEEDATGKQYRADETYVEETQNLLSAPEGELVTLESGRYSYPMEYTLPLNLPSSFIGKHGSITYVVKATLKQDNRFGLNTMITSEPFLVLRRLELSKDPTLEQPFEERVDKRLWGAVAFCLSGNVEATLRLNKLGHLPGEDIFLDAEISNNSPRTIKAVQASIIMHSTFNARNNVRNNSQIVNKKRDEWEMAYGEGRRWKNVRLTIPPYIPESRLDGCDIIDIRYELLFKVEVSGKNEIRISTPITVGTASTHAEEPKTKTTWRGTSAIMGPVEGEPGKMNGEGMNGHVDEDAVSVDLEDEEVEKFRYPMLAGETRRNPLFNNNPPEKSQEITAM